MGNAAIEEIKHENHVAEQKQLRASVDQLQATQSAELGASTHTFEAQTGAQAMADIRAAGQSTLNQQYAGTEQALEDRLAAMPDPSLAEAIAAVNGSQLHGTVTVEPLHTLYFTDAVSLARRSYIEDALAQNPGQWPYNDPTNGRMVEDLRAERAQEQYFGDLDAQAASDVSKLEVAPQN